MLRKTLGKSEYAELKRDIQDAGAKTSVELTRSVIVDFLTKEITVAMKDGVTQQPGKALNLGWSVTQRNAARLLTIPIPALTPAIERLRRTERRLVSNRLALARFPDVVRTIGCIAARSAKLLSRQLQRKDQAKLSSWPKR